MKSNKVIIVLAEKREAYKWRINLQLSAYKN